jgi:phosphate:Na+ symporter
MGMIGRTVVFFAMGVSLLFLGVRVMSTGLRLRAEGPIRRLLGKAGDHPWLGVGLGTVATGLMQSSSAVTVMLVSMTEAGLVTLQNAFAIMLGANIGTTITGYVMALPFENLGIWFILVGLLLMLAYRNGSMYTAGIVLAGCGLILCGMQTIGHGVAPLGEWTCIETIIRVSSKNRLFGILTGVLVTSILQSSSVFIGIVMVMAKEGVLGLSSAALLVLGSNIGTCITALIASIGTKTAGRRTAVGHTIFNLWSVLVFLPFLRPLLLLIETTSSQLPVQIANFHFLFNLLTVLVTIPALPGLVLVTQRVVPK